MSSKGQTSFCDSPFNVYRLNRACKEHPVRRIKGMKRGQGWQKTKFSFTTVRILILSLILLFSLSLSPPLSSSFQLRFLRDHVCAIATPTTLFRMKPGMEIRDIFNTTVNGFRTISFLIPFDLTRRSCKIQGKYKVS